jgi:hypothetical protein
MRILIDDGNIAQEGSSYRWSEADKMYNHERFLCQTIGRELGYRKYGGVQ